MPTTWSLWYFLGILIAFLTLSTALLFGLVGGVWLVLQALRALAFLVYAPLQWAWRKTTYQPRHLAHRERIEDIEEIFVEDSDWRAFLGGSTSKSGGGRERVPSPLPVGNEAEGDASPPISSLEVSSR